MAIVSIVHKEDTHLVAGPIRVGQYQARPDDVKSGIDMHGVGVRERDDMHLIGGSQMSLHPLYPHEVCHLKKKS